MFGFTLLLGIASFGCGDKCDTKSITYTNTVQAIVTENCLSCHFNGSGRSYSTYDSLTTHPNFARLLGAIRHDAGFVAMPQSGGKLEDCEIEKIEAWIADGAPR